MIAAFAHGYGDGAARAARYAYAALLVLALAGWARDNVRRFAAAVAVLILVADSYLTGWWIWWGSGDPTTLMYGNFYWHNQFAAYMLVGAAVAAVLVALARGPMVFVAYIVGALAGAGMLASGSRASVILGLGVLALSVLGGLASSGWVGAVRVAALGALTWATSWFMSSPVFFPGSGETGGAPAGSPTGTLAERGSAENSWTDRLSFWFDAIRIGGSSPLVGTGLQSYGARVQCLGSDAYSSDPHNEFLRSWAETGAVGAIPMLAILVGVVWLVALAVRAPVEPGVMRRWRWVPARAELRADPGRWAALVAVVVGVGHAAFDFDWSFPSLMALVGIVGGIAASASARGRVVTIVNLVLLAVLVAAAVTGFAIDPHPSQPLLPYKGFTGCA